MNSIQARNLETFMQEQGIKSNRDLCKRLREAGLEVTEGAVSKWRKGVHTMSQDNAKRISKAFREYPADWLRGSMPFRNEAEARRYAQALDMQSSADVQSCFETIALERGFKIDSAPNLNSVSQDGEKIEIGEPVSVVCWRDGKTVRIPVSVIKNLVEETAAYVEMRLSLEYERAFRGGLERGGGYGA